MKRIYYFVIFNISVGLFYHFSQSGSNFLMEKKTNLTICFHRLSQTFSTFHLNEISLYRQDDFLKRTEECFLNFKKNIQGKALTESQYLMTKVYDFHLSLKESSKVEEIYSLYESLEKSSDEALNFLDQDQSFYKKMIIIPIYFFYLQIILILMYFIYLFFNKENKILKKEFKEVSLQKLLKDFFKNDSFIEVNIDENLFLKNFKDQYKEVFYISKELAKKDYQEQKIVKISARQILDQLSIYFETRDNHLLYDIIEHKKDSINYKILNDLAKDSNCKIDFLNQRMNNEHLLKIALRINS